MPQQHGEQMPIPKNPSPPMMMPLIQHLCDFNNCQNASDLEEAIRKNYEANVQFVRSLQLQTNHLHPAERNFCLRVSFITRKSARFLLAFKGEMRTTVYQFYYLRHRRRLIHPQLPCIAVRGGNDHLFFYPLEVIDAAAAMQNDHKEKMPNAASTQTEDEDVEFGSSACCEEEEEEGNFDDERGKIVIKMASMTF